MTRGRSIVGLRGSDAQQRRVLEGLLASWRRAGASGSPSGQADPVFLARGYADPADREIAGLVAALFAYGRVEVFGRVVASVLRELGPSPRAALGAGRHLEAGFARDFRYRFQTRGDLVALLAAAARLIRREGSLGASLEARLPRARRGPEALDEALARWVRTLRDLAAPGASPGLDHLLADPARGGACKRWRLYLRWMIRPDDGIDCGVWAGRFVAADLTLPLDAHWIRIGPRLGLTGRRSPGLPMAREITGGLRRIAPDDPLRYDLPICHLGIGGDCPSALSPSHCCRCPLRSICAFARGGALLRRRAAWTRLRIPALAGRGGGERGGPVPRRPARGSSPPAGGGDRCDPN